MIINNKATYKCEFCGKLYQTKHWCIKHESNCKKNPENNQKCRENCIHLQAKAIIYICDNELTNQRCVSNGLYCLKKEIYVYPYWCKNPIPEDDIIDAAPNEPMPRECEFFDNGFD